MMLMPLNHLNPLIPTKVGTHLPLLHQALEFGKWTPFFNGVNGGVCG